MSWLDTMATNAGINKDYTQHEQDTATNSANGEKSLYDKKLLNIGPFNFSGKEIMDASQSMLDSAASVYGNIAYEFGNPYGIGDTLRNYAQQHEQAMGENTQPGFNYDYIMNGGLLRDTGTLAGSVLSLAPVGAAAAGGAAALGASAPVVGAVGGIASALGEAAAEGGGTLADSLAQGLSLDEAESRAREVTGKNALFLGATNALSGGMMGKFLKGVAQNLAGKGAEKLADGIANQSGLISQGTKETLKGAGTLGMSALNEGFQEAEQDAISASVDPNKYASYNPVYWSDEQWEDFNRTIGPTALMGLIGGAGGNASYNYGLARQNEIQEAEQLGNQANDMANTAVTSIPAQANYTIADEVSDANLSQGTESKLRMLDEAYYNQYGQHLYVTSMTRHWGTNSDHETGSAFDVADDGLANDSERRQWIAEKARQLGLNPLDEYENPSSGATGGHMHFSDKGGAINVDTSGWSGNADIDSLIADTANRYGIDANLLAAIAEQESGFNQGAKSEAGALGIMQLMPPTAEGLGVDATDLAGNIEGGAKYIRQMLDQFGGDVHKALEAYNGGPGGVGTAQTVKYADEVMQRYEKFKVKSAGTFSWSNPSEAKTSPTDYMKIMSDNNVTADTAGDFLQYVQLLAEDDANTNNEQVQKDGAKAVKAIADGSPDVMERVAKELGYGQVKQEVEQKAPNIPMPKIKQHVQQNGWVEIGNKKDADEFARTDYGKTLERVSNTKFVSPDFNAITGRVEQRTAQPQQIAQPAPKPAVQNTVREDAATKEDTATAEANSLRTSLPGSASALARILSQNPAAISYNGNNVDLNKLNNAIKNNDIETINGFNAHMMKNMSKNGVPLDGAMQEYLPAAKDMAGRLSKIPEAVHGANGISVDLRALQEAVSNNDLNRITAFNEKMSENLQSNGMSPYLALREVEADTTANAKENKKTEYNNQSNTNTTDRSEPKLQQVSQPAPQPTVQNKVQSDVASTDGQKIANNAVTNNTTESNLLSSIPNSAISLAKTLSQNPAAISYNGNNVDLNKLNNAIKNNDIKTINGFNAHMRNNMRKNNVSLDDVVKEHLPVAKDTAMRLSKIPEAIADAAGNRVDLRALQEAINNNDLSRINAISEKMAENLRSNGVSPYLAMRDTESVEEVPTGSTLPAVQGNRAPSTDVQDLGWRVEGEVESPITPPAPYTEAQLEAPAIESERDTLTSQEFLGKLNSVERQFMEYLDSVFDNTGVAFADIMQHLNSQRSSLLGKAIEMFKNGYAVDSVVFSRMNDTQRSALVNYRRMLDVYGNSLTNADRDVIDEFTRLDNIINEYLAPMAHNYLINNNVLNYRGIDNAIKGLEGIAAKAREYEQIKVSEGYREGRTTGNKVVPREDEEAISGSATAWGNVLHQTQKRGLPAETAGTKVQRFIETLPNKIVQKSHSNSLNAMTNYAGEKITKAERVERVIKNGDSIQKIENEYFVVAPSGNIKVTKSEYNYYNYLLNERKNDKSDNGSKEHTSTSRETTYEGRKALTEGNYKRGDVSVPENASSDEIGDLDIKTDGLKEFPDSNVRGKTKSTVITDDGKEFNVVYKVMSADDVVASNLPTDGLPVNSKYPSAMQPRNRQRAAMQEQITSMSNNLRPADLTESRNLNQGAPVIKSDGAVLNGNGRTIAIQKAWLNGKADKYKQYLLDNAEKLGINPADIENVEHPILVRVVQDELSKDDIMSMINSTTGGQRMSPSEQAKVDSGKIKSSTLNQYVAGSDLTSAANRNFLRDVLADIISPSERNAYYSKDGAINQDGVLRAQRALFALAYGDDTLLDAFSEAVNEEAKNFSNALKANAPLIARLQQLIKTGNATDLGLQKNLVSAVKALKEAVIAGKPAKSIWQEMSMFEDAEHSPETIAIARAMDGYRRSGKKLTQFVRNLAELGLKHGNPNQSGLFGEDEAPQVKLTDDIATAKEYVDTGNQMDMFAPKNSRSAFSFANPDTAEELKSVGDIDTPLDRLLKLPASKLRDGERKIQAFGKAIGVPVHFVNHPDKGYRGVFTHNGEVYINRNATVPAKAIFLHEFTHWLKASGKENRAVFDALAACVERDGGLFHERRLKQYRDRIFGGEQMTDEEIIEEIICDAMGNSKTAERISKAIDNFAPELNQSIWGRIKAMWDKFCKMVGFRQELSSKKQSLPNGLSQQEMAKFNAQLNILMSKMRTADGKPMFKVENYQLVVADNNQRPAEMFDINNINDYTPTYNIPAMSNSYSYQVHAQREAVRQQYEGTKEWMKAPNGEPTNLTEEQWLDVRTPNFKAWFGDWENNPDEASKVVDDNGEPLVVYHGSESQFDEFDTTKARANMDIQGMFFSPIQEEANDYGENVRAFFLNIKNPADYDTGYDALNNHKGKNLAGEKARNDLMENGYDGVNNDGEEYIAFNPNQIKSATENTGAFSPDTNNIKYSRGRAGITASTNNVGIFKRAMTALENKLKGKMPDNLDVRTYEDIETDRENARRAKAASRGKEYLDRSKEVSPLGQWWASPSRFAKKIPLISPFVQMGKIAVDKQEKLRVEFNSGMNEIEDLLGYSKWGLNDKRYKERKMALQEALLQGDINRKVFTDNELKSGGLDEQTIKAYHKMRELLDKAYTMADQTYSRTKYVSRNWSTAAEADGFMNDLMKKNPFVQIIQKKQNADGTVTYTYKEPHQYTVSALTVTEAELDELKKNKDVIITSEKHIYGDMFGNSTYRVTYHQKQANLGKIQGYIPHIFHGWLVCEVDKNGNIIKDSAGNIVVATSKNSMSEAVKEGKKIASQNTGKHYMVMPKLGKFSDGAAERATIMGDFAYSKTMSRVAKGMKMSIADAEKFMNGTVAVQNRGRFLAYAQHRKGVQGYEQNVFLATQMYFNQIARYVALDPFKRDAISMYNRLFGSFTDNTVMSRSENAKYVYAYINDMNGMPSGFEKWANKMLHNMGLGQEVANGRPALWLERMIFTYPFTIAKLGVFNVSSALLNLTQLFNLYGAMGEKVLSSAGYERLLKKGFMDARKAIVDKNSPLGQLVWKDLGLEAQIGIDVAGGYSRTEVNGLASLTGRLSKLAGGSMYLFRLSDTYTRAVTLLTAYNKALDEGMTKQEAIEYAKEINDKVNFDYSVADSPAIFRVGGPLSNVLLQFQKYPVKQIELFMDIFNDGRAAGLNRKQSALRLMKYIAPYMAFSGMMGIPFISLAGGILSAIMSAVTGDDDWDWQQKIKQYMVETFGADNPLTLWWLYGAGSFIGINVGSRVGVGVFMGIENREKSPIDSILGMTTATSTVAQTAKQLGYGNYAEAVKAISPSAGNILIGLKGEVHTTRGRMKYQYQNAYEQALRMIGFNPLNETMAGDIASNDYANKQADRRAKDDAIDDFLDEPTAENAARLNELGVTPKSIQTEMARRKMNRAELNRLAEAEKAEKAKKSKQKKKQYSVNDYLKGK